MRKKKEINVYGIEVPQYLVEPLIEDLCESLADWSFTLTAEEVLETRIIKLKSWLKTQDF